MKDRYANFIESQQDPYDDEYDEDGVEEEYDDDELEEEDGDEPDDEELEDEDGEELEDDEDETLEDGEEEEEEEEVPASRASASRPFGNGLNIQFGGSGNRNGGSPAKQPPAGGQMFKQVRPVPSGSQASPRPTPQTNVSSQAPDRNAAPSQRPAPQTNAYTQARPVQSGPPRDPAPSKVTQRAGEAAGFDAEEEEEEYTQKRGLLAGFLPWNWFKHDDAGEPDAETDEETAEETDPDEEYTAADSGRFRRMFGFFRHHGGEDVLEEAEEEIPETGAEKKFSQIRRRVSDKFSTLSNRVRGRLRTDESLEEFKEGLAESEDGPEEEPHSRMSRLKKAGIIGTSAAILLVCGYSGYKYLTRESKPEAETAAAAALEDGAGGTLSGLSSRAETAASETTPLDTLADDLNEFGETVTAQVNETLGEITSALPSQSSDASGGDALADDDLLGDSLSAAGVAVGAAAGAAAGTAIASGSTEEQAAADDQLDFDFGTPQTAESAEESISDELSVSSTTPPYGDNQSPPSGGNLSLDQFKADMADTGNQIKDGFKSGIEKVDSSIQKAGQKTGEFFDNAGQKINAAAQDLKDDFAQAGEQAKDASQRVSDWAGDTYDSAKEKVGDAAAELKNDLNQASVQAQDAAQRVGDWAGDTYQNAKNWTQDTAQRINDQTADSLQSRSADSQPLQLSLGQETKSEPLFLNAAEKNSNTVSSLGGSAANQFQPNSAAQNAPSAGRNTLLNAAAPAAAADSLGNTAPAAAPLSSAAVSTAAGAAPAPQNGAPVSQAPAQGALPTAQTAPQPVQSSAPIEIQNAMAQEAAAVQSAAAQQAEVVQGQTPDETFAAEADLSSIGFEAPRVEDGDPLSTSLSPFGGQYALPEETVSADAAAASAAANGGANAPAAGSAGAAQGGQQLSSLDYNPADQSASARYNGNQFGYSRLNGAAAPADTQMPSSGYRQYRTKAGDNLITIAENELGDGTRWAEISKLNSNQNLRGRLQEGLIILLPSASGGN